ADVSPGGLQPTDQSGDILFDEGARDDPRTQSDPDKDAAQPDIDRLPGQSRRLEPLQQRSNGSGFAGTPATSRSDASGDGWARSRNPARDRISGRASLGRRLEANLEALRTLRRLEHERQPP